MKRATRETEASRRCVKLQQKARHSGRPTDELIRLYALEGFLDRLTRSAGCTGTSCRDSPLPKERAAASSTDPRMWCACWSRCLPHTRAQVYDPCCGSDGVKALRRQARQARQAVTLAGQHKFQEKIQKLERQQRLQREDIFKAEDEIMEKRDGLIDSLERRLAQRTETETLFTIRWAVE